MTKIKICGLKRIEDIQYVNETKPDYAGFVFAGTKRKISFEDAARLKSFLDKDIKAVGVFVNEKIDNIIKLCAENVVDFIQLHGDEDEPYIYRLKERMDKPVIKAVKIQSSKFKVTPQVSSPKVLIGDTSSLKLQSSNADFILFDSGAGSGETFDWSLVKRYDKPFFLAGGLNEDNIEKALKTLSPYCVDLSSGVETDGLKDFEKIKKIINIVRGND